MIRRHRMLSMGGSIALALTLGACSGSSLTEPDSNDLGSFVAEPTREPLGELEPDIGDQRGCYPSLMAQGDPQALPEPC